MRRYFEKMDDVGRELRKGEIKRTDANILKVKSIGSTKRLIQA